MRRHQRILCTTCGKRRRARDGQLVPCDHSDDDIRGIDWAAFKAARLEECSDDPADSRTAHNADGAAQPEDAQVIPLETHGKTTA